MPRPRPHLGPIGDDEPPRECERDELVEQRLLERAEAAREGDDD